MQHAKIESTPFATMTIDSTAALLAALLFVLLLLCQLKRMFCIDYGIGKSIESNILRESRTLKNKNEPNKCCSISSWLLYCYFIFDWKYENLCNLLIVISRNIPEIFGFTLFFSRNKFALLHSMVFHISLFIFYSLLLLRVVVHAQCIRVFVFWA